MSVNKKWVREIMVDWITFTDNLMEMSKEDTLFAMELENERDKPRKTVLKRLTQRYNSIAAEEVRREVE